MSPTSLILLLERIRIFHLALTQNTEVNNCALSSHLTEPLTSTYEKLEYLEVQPIYVSVFFPSLFH